MFRHGVASADPLPDGVLLWTRCTTGGPGPVSVDWWVSRAPEPTPAQVVARGTAEASSAGDFTVHVDVRGLEPATTYWYGFTTDGASSPVGRTRTAPALDAPPAGLRLGLASCAYWSCGFFNVYANLAARDLDLVVHVGDYIYENDIVSRRREAVRAHRPSGPAVDLAGYRARYAQYRTDPDLQALHARHPVVAVWDDHEFAGGAWRGGATAHRLRHGSWEARRAAAMQAYFEWIPLRRTGPESVCRTIGLGPLADLVMLDTREVGRDRPATDARRPVWRVGHTDRALLGEDQWRWLEADVSTSSARWLLIGNQVMMAPVRFLNLGDGMGVNPGQWDGYPAERDRLYDLLQRTGWASNVAVLSGDIHSSWAADLPVGAEFVSPSVTTDTFTKTVLPAAVPRASALACRWFLSQNGHLRMADLDHHGYVTVDVTEERIQGDWWHVDTIARREAGERWGGGWFLDDGHLGLHRADAPSPPRPSVH
ncbi:MAG: alkaline phosphatase D family protein [Actinomycetota bacterium]|nr:alkaline phosphatase D family protein [Actinomycetota bacterium]